MLLCKNRDRSEHEEGEERMVSIQRITNSVNDGLRTDILRPYLFKFGDCIFLIFVGVITALLMHFVHWQRWPPVLIFLAGMSLAMIVQFLLAVAVAPVLGSIESMVPSMLVAMVVPMIVCVFDMMGVTLSPKEILTLGVGGGLSGFLLIVAYGRRCRRSLHCGLQETRGL